MNQQDKPGREIRTLTMEEIHEWFYEKDGFLYWKKDRGQIKADSKVTRKDRKGYLTVGFKGKAYLVHRILFALYNGYFPVHWVDHADRNPANNSKSNLRKSNPAQNTQNARRRKTSNTGFIGVLRANSKLERYTAVVKYKGKNINCGTYSCPIEAAKARDKKVKELHGEFAIQNFKS